MKIFESLEVPKVQIELEAIFKAFQEVKKRQDLVNLSMNLIY